MKIIPNLEQALEAIKVYESFLYWIESTSSVDSRGETDGLSIDGNHVMLTPRVKAAWEAVCSKIDELNGF